MFTGRVSGDTLTFDGGHTFAKPTSKDIFTCNHGPFTNDPADSDDKKGLLARLAAGFNRSIMLTHAEQPNGAGSGDYYKDAVTNHWARVVHANSPSGTRSRTTTSGRTGSRMCPVRRTTPIRAGSR